MTLVKSIPLTKHERTCQTCLTEFDILVKTKEIRDSDGQTLVYIDCINWTYGDQRVNYD